MAKVSVIVPTYNRPEMLKRALRSIKEQTYRSYEIVVVNDAGQNVETIAKAFGAHYVEHGENYGLAAARNTGIRASAGEYIAYLDDDDWYYPDHLLTLVGWLDKHPETGAVYSDAHRAWDSGYKDVPYSQAWDNAEILRRNITPVCCVVHRRSALPPGLFDEELRALEDWDLWIRMSRAHQFDHLKQVTCAFRWATDGSTMTGSRQTDFAKASARIAEKVRRMNG